MRRDAVDWILFGVQVASLVGTAAAAIFAAVSIRQSKNDRAAADRALIRERRIDFELDVLSELADLNLQGHNVIWVTERFRVRAAILPVDLVPLSRASVDLPSTPSAVAAVGQHRARKEPAIHLSTVLQEQIQSEIIQAIDHRLAERGPG